MTGEPLIEVVFMVADVNDVKMTSPLVSRHVSA